MFQLMLLIVTSFVAGVVKNCYCYKCNYFRNCSSMLCERNLAVFVWTENSADVIMSDIWQSASVKTLTDSGGLILKARAFTPAVQK